MPAVLPLFMAIPHRLIRVVLHYTKVMYGNTHIKLLCRSLTFRPTSGSFPESKKFTLRLVIDVDTRVAKTANLDLQYNTDKLDNRLLDNTPRPRHHPRDQ